MVGPLRIRLLGPLEVTAGDIEVGPRGSRRRSLLALLALRANSVVSVDELVDGLWGNDPPGSATAVVQTYVSTWRKAFDAAGEPGTARIDTVGAGYRLDLATDECDLLRFLDLARRGRQGVAEGRWAAARTVLEVALALWRGPVLPELADEPFHAEAARPAENRRVEAVEDWSRAVLGSGADADLPAVLEAVQQLRATQPWREQPVELLMWTLFRLGRQRESLELYEATRHSLVAELGVDPGPALRDMHRRVLRQDPGLRPAAPRATVRVTRRPDAFVGRQAELADVLELLHSHRLVTLTGPGGSGKTRLAEEVAARSALESLVVDLAPLDDAALVPATIAGRLGLATGEPLDVLLTEMAHRPVLLVLDNAEHLRDVGPTVSAILRNTTEMRVLVTSREALHLTGEQRYGVLPLAVPAADERDPQRLAATAAIELLTARALEGDPDFRVTEANAENLREIVRTLDGLPLALEIVAPWLRTLGPDGVLTQLTGLLDLSGRRADTEQRHRTLREAIAWSVERSTPDQQRLLSRLSVLRGGGVLEAVRAVGGEDLGAPVVEVLADLVDRHLVQPPGPTEGAPRFGLLETIRRYAAERLAADGDAEATEARAAAWFIRWAARLAANSEGPATASWQAQAAADADNLRVAMEFLDRTGQRAASLELVVDTMALWFEAGHEREGEQRLERALTTAPGDAPARAMGLAYLSWLVAAHDGDRAAELARTAADIARDAGDDPVLAFALQCLGGSAANPDDARSASTEALGVARRVGSRQVRYGPTAGDAVACGATANLAAIEAHRSLPTALDWQRRALTLAEEEGDRRIVAANSARLGLLHLLAGDAAAATEPVQRAARMVTGPLTARWEDIVASAQATLLRHQERTGESLAAYRALTTSTLAGGRVLHMTEGSCGLADLLTEQGRLEDARTVLWQARSALRGAVDPRHAARLQVRRARLLRLDGRSVEAVHLLEQARGGLQEDALAPERIVWLVESAALSADPDRAAEHAAELERMSVRTGIRVPPWELRQLRQPRGAGPVG